MKPKNQERPRRKRLAARMKAQQKLARDKMRQGVGLLPSLLTVMSVFFSFWAIIVVFDAATLSHLTPNEGFLLAPWLIFGSFLCDGLDGRVARMTGTTSEFGVQLDSLADVLSFGIAPALLVYTWALQPFGRIGWIVSFLFVSCGAVRLARFNVQSHDTPVSKRYFTGLPIPMAALTLVLLIANFPEMGRSTFIPYATLPLVGILSFLMVSTVRFRSFKDIDLKKRRGFRTVAFVAVILAILALEPQGMLLGVALVYVLSGPLARILPERFYQQVQLASQSIEDMIESDEEDDLHADEAPQLESHEAGTMEAELVLGAEPEKQESSDNNGTTPLS